MATFAVQVPTVDGAPVTFDAAAGGGDEFPNTGVEIVLVKNDSGAPITVTFDAPNACSLGVISASHDKAESVAAGATQMIGPFSKARFNDVDGMVQMTYSGVTSLTVAVVRP